MRIETFPARDAVRVAIAGVGNCASSFVQGLTYYRDRSGNEPIPGLMNADVGGYRVKDVEISAAFDVSATKVGLDVASGESVNQNEWAPVLAREHIHRLDDRGRGAESQTSAEDVRRVGIFLDWLEQFELALIPLRIRRR